MGAASSSCSEDEGLSEDDQDPQKVEARRVAREQALRWRKMRGRQGVLSAIPQLSVDLLVEARISLPGWLCDWLKSSQIASYLPAEDLFAFSRSISACRKALLARPQLFHQALLDMGVPALPPDWDPVRFCALMFGSTCICCGRRGGKPQWDLRVRLCSKTQCRKPIKSARKLDDDTLNALHFRGSRDDKKHAYYWDADLAALHKRIDQAIQRDKSLHPLMVETSYQRERRLFTRSLAKDRAPTLAFISDLEAYLVKCEHAKKLERAELRAERREFIRSRLLDDGYDMADVTPVLEHESIDKAEALTEIKWRNLFSKLAPVLAQNQADRLAEEQAARRLKRVKAIARQWRARSANGHLITLGSLLAMEPLQALLDPDETANDIGTLYVGWAADVDSALDACAPLIEDWHNSTRAALVQKAGGADDSVLDTCIFRCRACSGRVFWPALLGHVCLRRTDEVTLPYAEELSGLRFAGQYRTTDAAAKPFDVEDLVADPTATSSLGIMLARGMAIVATQPSWPQRATPSHAHLEALGRRFYPKHRAPYELEDFLLWSQVIGRTNDLAPTYSVSSDILWQSIAERTFRPEVLLGQPVYRCAGCQQLLYYFQRSSHGSAVARPHIAIDENEVRRLLQLHYAVDIEEELQVARSSRARPFSDEW